MNFLKSLLRIPFKNTNNISNLSWSIILFVSSLDGFLLFIGAFTTYPDNLIYILSDNLLMFLPQIIIIGITLGIADTLIIGLLLYLLIKKTNNEISFKSSNSIIIPYKALYTLVILALNIILIISRINIPISNKALSYWFLALLLLMPISFLLYLPFSLFNIFNRNLVKTIFRFFITFVLSLALFIGQIYIYHEISKGVGRLRLQSFIKNVNIPTGKLFSDYKRCVEGDCENGKGKASYNYGFSYIGDFKNGIPNGYGELYRYQIVSNRLVNKGFWENGKLIKKE